MIDRYRLLELIGEGGMGEVWLADQQEPVRRRVALKVIKPGLDSARVIARFEAERQALALMDHPAIAKVFDAGTTPEGRPYFVMEHVPGIPITAHCDGQRLPTRDRLDLFLLVCEGVQHAHQKAVIHRDLKPSNVLVMIQDGRAVPKIIDFGVAKATAQRLTEMTLHTELGALIGTPEYMSPEQAERGGQDIDTRADVYALGVMLYELLVGCLPFEGKHLRAAGYEGIVRVLREVEPPKPSTRLTTLPGERSAESARRRGVDPPALRRLLRGDLDWIVMKALEKDRTRRYNSPIDLAADIRRHLRNEPVLAGPPDTLYRVGKFVRRHRIGVAAAGVIVLGLGIGLLGAILGLTRARQAETQARREAEASGRVSRFLADMLGSVDASQMGESLKADLQERVAASLSRQGVSDQKRTATLREFDRALASVNWSDAALTVLDTEVLQRAGKVIDRELAAEPQIAARLEDTLGQTYLNLGLTGPAEFHARRALEIRTRILGPEHGDTLVAMRHLGDVLRQQSRWEVGPIDEAERLFREAADIQRRVLGDDHPETLASMGALALFARHRGHADESVRILEETLEKQRRVLGRRHEDTLETMGELSKSLSAMGQHERQVELSQEAFDTSREIFGADDPRTLAVQSTLGWAHLVSGHLEAAERVYLDVLERQRRVHGTGHPATLDTLEILVQVYAGSGDKVRPYTEALLASLKTAAKAPGAPARVKARYANKLLTCEPQDLRDSTLAVGLAREAVEETGGQQVNFLELLANAYESAGQAAGAAETRARAIAVLRVAAGQPDAGAGDKNDYAWALLTYEPKRLRDPGTALRFALEAVEAGGWKDPSALDTLSLAYHLNGQTGKAIEIAKQALALAPEWMEYHRETIAGHLAMYEAALRK